MELLKKYSTLDEVLLYLKDKIGYDYTLDDIYQLETYLYLTNPRIRLEIANENGDPSYDFRYVPLKGIFKRSHKHSVFLKEMFSMME